MGNLRHVHLIIYGRVQGVWFRASAMETADRLGIKGSVRNLPDGNVEVEAQGKADTMEKFIEWCHKGPPGAHVTKVDIEELEAVDDIPNFKIERYPY